MKNRAVAIMIVCVLILEMVIIFLICNQMGLISIRKTNGECVRQTGECPCENCCRHCCCCRPRCCCCEKCKDRDRKCCDEQEPEPVPSKTTSDIGGISGFRASSGLETGSGFSVFIARDIEEVLEEIAGIYKFEAENGSAPIEYFDGGLREKIGEKMPDNTNLKMLELNEFLTIEAAGYKRGYGEIEVDFDLATQYDSGQSVVALVGVFGGKDASGRQTVEWTVLDVSAEDGLVKVVFTADSLEKINGNPSAFAVMNTPKEKSN